MSSILNTLLSIAVVASMTFPATPPARRSAVGRQAPEKVWHFAPEEIESFLEPETLDFIRPGLVIKVNSVNIDAFEAPESGPVAYVAGEDVRLTRSSFPMPVMIRPVIRTRRIEPNVAMISCYTGMDGMLIDRLLHKGLAGLVLGVLQPSSGRVTATSTSVVCRQPERADTSHV